MEKIVLIDSNALIHRAFHALPSLSAPNGQMVNAFYGFTSLILKMLKDIRPDYAVAAFDLAGPTFRHEAYEDYKSHRVRAPQELYDQIPLSKDLLKAFGIPVVEKEGYEADDLIGSLSYKFRGKKNLQVIIISGDLDTLQLVNGQNVVVYTLRKGLSDIVVYDEKAVKNRFSLTPSQLADYRGLKGDPSDNIPGVPGIGEKTAIELLKEFKTLDNLFQQLEKKNSKFPFSEKLKEKLLFNKDQAFFSKQLSTIIIDLGISVSLEDAKWFESVDQGRIKDIFQTFGFASLLKRLGELSFFHESIFLPKLSDNFLPSKKEIKTQSELDEVFKQSKDKTTAFWLSGFKDSENEHLHLSGGSSCVFTVPLALIEVKKLSDFFNSKGVKITHGLKNFLKRFPMIDIVDGSENFFDTQIGGWLINSDLKEPKLDHLYFSEFSKHLSDDQSFYPSYILDLYIRQKKTLEDMNLYFLFQQMEAPLIQVLSEMESNGVLIDQFRIKSLNKEISSALSGSELNIFKHAGIEFNINSSQQLSEILFERLNLKGRIKKTPGGVLSTAASELEKLQELHPIVNLVLEYRELQKLKTTYIDPFPQLIQSDGRIHTSFIQTGTATGRLSSQEPNLQNIPVRTELGQEFRKTFVAESGKSLISLDYSQIELRIAAHLSGDEKLIRAFKSGEDIHTRTAVEVFGVNPKDVSAAMRREAKILNFGMIYGMGIRAFAQAAGIKQDKAKAFMERYFKEFEGISAFLEQTRLQAHENGYVSTLFGRRRQLNDLNASMPQVVRQAERMAVNMPIQGTAADIMKLAMIKVHAFLHKNFSNGEVKMLVQVHDELLLEARTDLSAGVIRECKEIMENAYELKLPLVVDVKYGKNWGEMKNLET